MAQQPETLAKRIRAKYPGAYGDLTDQALEASIDQKYPGVYADVPRSTEQVQAPASAAVSEREPNSLETFARHVGTQLNPIAAVQAVSQAVQHPIETGKNIGAAQGALFEKAKTSYAEGDHLTAARHFVNYLLPLIGPALDEAADAAQRGEFAASSGDVVGLGLGMFGPKAAATAISAPRAAAPVQRVAQAAQEGATNRAVRVMAPQVGPNKIRLGNVAAKVAPDVLRKTSSVTKGGLQREVANNLDTAHGALDAAYDAIPNTQMYGTAPILTKINNAIADLSVSGVGGRVEPSTRAARLAALKQAAKEVRALGSVVNADNLRKLRIAWDEGAKAVFTPAVAPDALKLKGMGSGWADARTTLNNFLLDKHPELKPLNADVSLWTKARDVMQAAEEIERVRPTVGRTLIARGLGAAAGASQGGGIGAMVGAVVGPMVESGFAALSPTRKLFVARQLQALADALRAGQGAKATAIITGLEKTLPAGPVLQRLAPTAEMAVPAEERQRATQ